MKRRQKRIVKGRDLETRSLELIAAAGVSEKIRVAVNGSAVAAVPAAAVAVVDAVAVTKTAAVTLAEVAGGMPQEADKEMDGEGEGATAVVVDVAVEVGACIFVLDSRLLLIALEHAEILT